MKKKQEIKVRKTIRKKTDSTDINLLVSPSSKDIFEEWDKSKIIEALKSEAGVGLKLANDIASSVEKKIKRSKLKLISSSLIRELVDNELFSNGQQKLLQKQQSIGLPKHDIEELVFNKSNDNSNVTVNNPEAIGFSIAENVSKQYALQHIFSSKVADAHRNGLVYLHDLGHPFRVYCSSHSIEYVKKYGLQLDNLDTSAAPAKHARTLSSQVNTFLAVMQMYYAGALGLAYINIMYAPLLEGMSDAELYQEAQALIYQSAQNAFSRGGQSVRGTERLIIYDSNSNSTIYPMIEDFYNNFNIDKDKGRYLTLSMNRLTGCAEWKHVIDAIRHVRKNPLVRVSLFNGSSGVFTSDHSLFTIDSNGDIIDVSASNVKSVLTLNNIDAKIYSKINVLKYLTCEYKVSGNCYTLSKYPYGVSIPCEISLNYDTGFIIGAYIGDGSRCDGSGGVAISCTDHDHRTVIINKWNSVFNCINAPIMKEEDRSTIAHGKIYQNFFENLCGLHANNKKVPDEIMFGPIDAALGFIDGYISADGTVGKNKIETTTVSELLHNQLNILYSRLGCMSTKLVRNIKGKTININGSVGRANFNQLRTRIGICDFNKIKISKNQKENKRIECVNDGITHRDSKGYNYNIIKSLIKKVFRSKISLKCNRIDIRIISRIKALLDISIDYINKNDIYDISKVKETMDNLYLYNNIYRGTGQNTSDKNFGLRYVNSNIDEFKSIVDVQANNIKHLYDIITKCNNIIPYNAISEELPDNDKYVYDISVQDNENFVLLNGIVAHNSLFIDFNIHTGVPNKLRDVKAIGPGGKYLDKTYGDFEDTSIRFAKALLQVWGNGDINGTVFAFPKCDFHISEDTFKDKKQLEVYNMACEIAAKNGSVYFVFDRDEVTLSACCRLRTTVEDDYLIKHPESMRFCGFQNISINLPQCAYRSGGDYKKFIKEMYNALDICIMGHVEKRNFVHKLMVSPGAPLWQIGRIALDGRPYIDLNSSTYIVGIIGLNECLKYLYNVELHEDNEALQHGLKIISALYFKIKELGKKYNMKITLEESPAESASRRLAKIDIANYKDAIVRGSVDNDNIYYTNSVHIRPDANVNMIDRIVLQSKFHGMIESGAIVHAFIGESRPSVGAIGSLVKKTFDNTNCAQLTISPEFTLCNSCFRTFNGLLSQCPNCKAKDIRAQYYDSTSKLKEWSQENLGSLSGKRILADI